MTVRMKNPYGDTVVFLRMKKSFDENEYKVITRYSNGKRNVDYIQASEVDRQIWLLHSQGWGLAPLEEQK